MLVREIQELSARPLYLICSMWGKDVTVDEIANKTDADLASIKGMGPRYLREVRALIPYAGEHPNESAKNIGSKNWRGARWAESAARMRGITEVPTTVGDLPAGVVIKVRVDPRLATRVETYLKQRSLTIDQAVGLYLRAMINTSERSRSLRLGDIMPFGKYAGERVEVILRAEPGYISWLIANNESIRWDPEVLLLLEQLTAHPSRALKEVS